MGTDKFKKHFICLVKPEKINKKKVYVNNNDDINIYYHSLYSILDFDWLIHLQITACKYRSAANILLQITGANTLLSMRTLKMFVSFNKKISFFQNVNMARFAHKAPKNQI